MDRPDTDRLLAMLRDPNVESRDVAAAVDLPREDVARAARVVVGMARAKPEDAVALPAPLALAACHAALAAGRADVLAALALHPGKEVGKEAKRGLHVLKARGVAVPEAPRPAVPAPAVPAEPPPACYATAVDVRGERALWLTRAVPGKGIEIAQAVVSDELGLVELQTGLLGRKEWRALAKGLLERGAAMGVGEVSRAEAEAVVREARTLNGPAQRVPEGADLWLAQLPPAQPPPDPAGLLPALGPAEEAEALAASGGLHDLPLFASWLPDEPFLREIAGKLDEAAASPLLVDEAQRAAHLLHTVEGAVEAWFTPARRAALARRLLAIAAHLAGRGDAPRSAQTAAAARALQGAAPPRDIPFARRLVEKAFPGVVGPSTR